MGRIQGDIQLTLENFERTRGPLCKGNPGRDACFTLCVRCAYAIRDKIIVCSLFTQKIRSGDKYNLKAWKVLRQEILERDEQSCSICGATRHLHVHHRNRRKTDDFEENLLVLCDICHARVHGELEKPGGEERVERILGGIRNIA